MDYDKKEEEKWERLFDALEQNKIIPVLGRGLLVNENNEDFYSHVALQLLKLYDISPTSLKFTLTLNNVAIFLINQIKDPHEIKNKVNKIIEQGNYEIPQAIKQLVKIDHLRLFLSTTFDSFLIKAIKNHRGPEKIKSLSFSYFSEPEDIIGYEKMLNNNISSCLQLFGKANRVSDFVIMDEDLLEYIIRFYSLKSDKLTNLFDVVRNNQLLFIGCYFPDWLGKFFIRALTKTRFMSVDQPIKYLSDDIDLRNIGYTYFLENYKGFVFNLNPLQFVDQLYKRWSDKFGSSNAAFKRFVFISYAHADKAKVLKLVNFIKNNSNINIWFDESQLISGDNYESVIIENIRDCALFVPVISKTTVETFTSNPEPYYKKEWIWAKRGRFDLLEKRNSPNTSFICPIIIDEELKRNEITWLNDYFEKTTVSYCTSESNYMEFCKWISNKIDSLETR